MMILDVNDGAAHGVAAKFTAMVSASRGPKP
jgi:hypothetical protein